jgi:ABC-type nickel/cobalt efflux system permease component RcnA
LCFFLLKRLPADKQQRQGKHINIHLTLIHTDRNTHKYTSTHIDTHKHKNARTHTHTHTQACARTHSHSNVGSNCTLVSLLIFLQRLQNLLLPCPII